MLFVVTSKYNPSASFVFEGLYRCMKVFRDYLGVLSEEAIRKNFILIYEIIDEMFDYGHTQIMTTEAVKEFIVNTPIVLKQSGSSFTPSILSSNVLSSSAIQQTVAESGGKSKSKREQIFVDIFDKLTVLFLSLIHI